jgi:uncharacterized protein involved in outer membrane biogenesis
VLAREKTGRELRIFCRIRVALLPRITLAASDATLSSMPNGVVPNMLEIKAVEVSVKPSPLWRGIVEADQISFCFRSEPIRSPTPAPTRTR